MFSTNIRQAVTKNYYLEDLLPLWKTTAVFPKEPVYTDESHFRSHITNCHAETCHTETCAEFYEDELTFVQHQVKSIAMQLSGEKIVTLTDNLFSLGGDALFIIEFIKLINQVFSVKLTPVKLSHYNTVIALSYWIESSR